MWIICLLHIYQSNYIIRPSYMRNIILLLVFATLAITCNKKDDPAIYRNTLSATISGTKL